MKHFHTRYHKRLKLCPGVHLNFSKHGMSLSLGVAGLSWNINKDGSMFTVGAPGTGVSVRSRRR